ncbi:MAG: sulfotransferase domain-containing protein [Planctomycetota bacterium]|nr:sulfotransferase domain-containing protein [Planctomycetota bacterium]
MVQDKPNLIHCSYHKCLTKYYSKVMLAIFSRRRRPWKRGYSHFNSWIDRFMSAYRTLDAASVNNHVLDLEVVAPYRITRFIRDPRDMIVSGYHYHKRAAEAWCEVTDPTEKDWQTVNGRIPDGMQPGESYSQMLQRLDIEDGLYAEMQFREKHYKGMMAWPTDDPNILVIRYEDIIGNEEAIFSKMLDFYEIPRREKARGLKAAIRNTASRVAGKNSHIRNPEPNQWKRMFTQQTEERFEALFPGLIERTGYA